MSTRAPTITYEHGVRIIEHRGVALARPLITSRPRIVAVMAEDMRQIAAAAGAVTEAGLKLAGWTAQQIASCHEAAATRACALAAE